MSILDGLLIAFTALRANLLRSILATLGIIIGVASVIVMVAVGQGARSAVDKRIASFGTNLLIVIPVSARSLGRRSGSGTSLPFTEGNLAAVRDGVPGVVGISGMLSSSVSLVYGNANWIAPVRAVHVAYIDVRAKEIEQGRALSSSDERGARKVALVGATVVKQLFGDQVPVGRTIRIRNVPFKVIGTLVSKGQSGARRDQDVIVFIPLSTGRGRIVRKSSVQPHQVGSLHIKIGEGTDLAEAKEEIERLMRIRRRIRPGADDNFFVLDLAEYIRARTAARTTLSILRGATAAISLIVGGIGIINIMLVSVSERTREIGLRMAIGARRSDIRWQFLVEAVVLCLVGGLIGIVIGVGTTFAIATFADWPVLLEPWVTVLALGASAGVGIFFGYFPARRAAQLNPIDALRSE